jgi:hypothetical protein
MSDVETATYGSKKRKTADDSDCSDVPYAIEHPLFSWKDVDQSSDCYVFYKCVLKVKMGPFDEGTKVKKIEMDYGRSTIKVTKTSTDASWEGGLKLSIC